MNDMNDGIMGVWKGMPIMNVYCTLNEFSDHIKRRLTKEDLDKFKDCTFVPLKLDLDEKDLYINALIVPVKNI